MIPIPEKNNKIFAKPKPKNTQPAETGNSHR
jgi:hypothetical protein